MTTAGFIKDILIDNPQNAGWNIRRVLHIADPRKSWQWKDSETHYNGVDVKGKRALMLGSDYGVTPMYLIQKGVESVVGFSLWKQYFFHPRYTHIRARFSMDGIRGMDFDVLFADCEGCEYQLREYFLSSLDDYVICFHDPIGNQQLFDYVKSQSVSITPPLEVGRYNREIAILMKGKK